MSLIRCSACLERGLSWHIDEEFAPLCQWTCHLCNYVAQEDELFEGECPGCRQPNWILMYDAQHVFRYCSICRPSDTLLRFALRDVQSVITRCQQQGLTQGLQVNQNMSDVLNLNGIYRAIDEITYTVGCLVRDRKMSSEDAGRRVLSRFPFLSDSNLQAALSMGSWAAHK
jgi:hypothetical protein